MADPRVLSVSTYQNDEDRYVPCIALNDRILINLTRETALSYAFAWAEAIARAEHDAAVIRQVADLTGDNYEGFMVVAVGLRADRPPLDAAAVAPLRLEPIVSRRTGRGLLTVFLDDEKLVQLDGAAVFDHIGKVLPAVASCALDDAYHQFLTTTLEQSPERANTMVYDLNRWLMPADQAPGKPTTPKKPANAPRPSRQGPAALPATIQEALLAYSAAVAATRAGRAELPFAAMARQELVDRCVAAGLDPGQVVPPPGVSLNPGGRWIPAKRSARHTGNGTNKSGRRTAEAAGDDT